MYKVVVGQIEQAKENIHKEITETVNLFPELQTKEVMQKIKEEVQNKQNAIDKCMTEGIDIGDLINYVVIPFDVVKIEYDDNTSCFCFAVKDGRKKVNYYYIGRYI